MLNNYIQIIDKILPREETEIINNLLEFDETKDKMTVDEEIENFLVDEENEGEISLRKAIQDVKLIRKNIIKLQATGYNII